MVRVVRLAAAAKVASCPPVRVIRAIPQQLQLIASPQAKKKADVVKHPEVFSHIGLLFTESSGVYRIALC